MRGPCLADLTYPGVDDSTTHTGFALSIVSDDARVVWLSLVSRGRRVPPDLGPGTEVGRRTLRTDPSVASRWTFAVQFLPCAGGTPIESARGQQQPNVHSRPAGKGCAFPQ